MIQDATGKFSSRWVLPDRRSLAVVIQNRLHLLNMAIRVTRRNKGNTASLADPIYGVRQRCRVALVPTGYADGHVQQMQPVLNDDRKRPAIRQDPSRREFSGRVLDHPSATPRADSRLL